jgi:hypothetical protein
MYVFVSWAYLDVAVGAEERRVFWLKDMLEKEGLDAGSITFPGELSEESEESEEYSQLTDKLSTEFCLPEYDAWLKARADNKTPIDRVNGNLLGVRFVIPEMEKVVTYQLSKRMPGTGKLPVSLACRSLLLNTFKGEWTGDLIKPGTDRLVLVGMKGIKNFLKDLAIACAALGEPLPVDLWQRQSCVALPEEKKLRELVDACAFNKQGESDQEKYKNLILGWMGPGASAERDSAIALATGFRLGLRGT